MQKLQNKRYDSRQVITPVEGEHHKQRKNNDNKTFISVRKKYGIIFLILILNING
jgi:hypothetical protein